MNRILIQNQRGQSLVQVMISLGIMCLMMTVFATMMVNQLKETRALSEKLAAMDLEKLLIASLADGSVCSYVLGPNPSWQTFDSTLPLPQTITLTNPSPDAAALYISILPGPTNGPLAVQVGKPVSAVSSRLTVTSIQLQIASGASGSYLGNWIVNFDPATEVRALKPVFISTKLTVDTTIPTSAKITGCQSTLAPSPAPAQMLTAGMGYDGQTGSIACASIRKACVYVVSYNYIEVDAACNSATNCAHFCSTGYNQSLPGAPNGLDLTNIHSCAALIGNYVTYLDPGIVQCNGIFSAFCD